MKKARWTAEEDQDLLQRWSQGYAMDVIASHLNRTEAAASQHLRQLLLAMPVAERTGWDALRLDNRVFSLRQDHQMLRYHQEGVSVRRIAWKLDCPVVAVQKRLDQLKQKQAIAKVGKSWSWMSQP